MSELDAYRDLRSAEELEAALRRIGAERYHIHHPFHRMLHSGRCTKGQVQAWALNRYVYQSRIPMKDASLMGRCPDRELRRHWLVRILDHDGFGDEEGVSNAGSGSAKASGSTATMWFRKKALPATKFAVEAYVRFVREQSLLEAVASSLTELFAPAIHEERIPGLLKNYPFVTEQMVAYFRKRLDQAPRDAGFALEWVKRHADTPEKRFLVCKALIFKCDVLWAQLDALYSAYVAGAGIPKGAFVPADHGEAKAA